jgi:DNA-binding transcriptional MerR regulator
METRRDPIAPVDPADHADHLPTTAPPRLGVADLAEAAGVSVRTVRYYIAEGILPPPLGAGSRAAYTAEHLDRLRLIARLKDAYLPLREIRRRLRGLDGSAVRALLAEVSDGIGPHPEEAPRPQMDRTERSPVRSHLIAEDSAAAYLSRLLPPRPGQQPASADVASPARSGRVAPFASSLPQPAPVGEPPRTPEQESERSESAQSEPGDPNDSAGLASLTRADLDRGAALAALGALAEPDAAPAEPWHRLQIGDDAELLIRAAAYERQREQIDALVAWARRILH